jgi:hypothetical protein
MATVFLERGEVEDRDLPFVCLRCGRPADLWKTKRFMLAGHWAASLGKLTQIEVPVCDSHRKHWLRREIFGGALGGPLVAGFLLGLLAVAEPGQVSPALRGPLGIVFGISFLGLILWVPTMSILYYTSIRPTVVTRGDITLAGVAADFVAELKKHRRAARERRRAEDDMD